MKEGNDYRGALCGCGLELMRSNLTGSALMICGLTYRGALCGCGLELMRSDLTGSALMICGLTYRGALCGCGLELIRSDLTGSALMTCGLTYRGALCGCGLELMRSDLTGSALMICGLTIVAGTAGCGAGALEFLLAKAAHENGFGVSLTTRKKKNKVLIDGSIISIFWKKTEIIESVLIKVACEGCGCFLVCTIFEWKMGLFSTSGITRIDMPLSFEIILILHSLTVFIHECLYLHIIFLLPRIHELRLIIHLTV